MIRLKWENKSAFDNLGKEWEKAIYDGIDMGMKMIGTFLVGEMKKDIIAPSKGSKKAIRYNPKRDVKVSPPGTSPNSDQGELVSSITYNSLAKDTIIVGSAIHKGGWLNYGVKNRKRGGTLAPRPFIEPNIEKNQDKMAEMLMERIESRMKARGVK